ncbi:MAG: PhoD-like phosphatase N-terminal domain-containing protein, partial [Methylococcales bacterium]|nr:PhoD-like phosphatase N-terminal domain-containing protein [Methylococcales bacterium]
MFNVIKKCLYLKRPLNLTALSIASLPLLFSMTINASAGGNMPLMEQGIQLGDLAPGRAIVWSRSDRPARMFVAYAFNDQFVDAITLRGPYAMEDTDFTARQDLVNLPEGKDVFVKVWFEALTNARHKSESVTGHFHTLGRKDNVRFVWGGDTAGQGWGINEDFGGMKIYEA